MRSVFYRTNSAFPKAVVAEQNDNGYWVIENEAEEVSTPLPDERFKSQYSTKPRDNDTWSSTNKRFTEATLAAGLEAGNEPVWLNTKDEVNTFANNHPDAWFLNLSTLTAWKRGDLPWGHMAKREELPFNENTEQWSLPLVVLVPAKENPGRPG